MHHQVVFPHPATLVDLLAARAEGKGDALAYRFLVDGEIDGPAESLTYAALFRRARAIGALLQEANARGERALLLYPPGLDFISAFFGCQFGEAIAVPAYPPDPARLARTLPRLRAIARDCGARFVLTTSPLLALAEALFPEAPELASLRWFATDALEEERADQWRKPDIVEDTIAFLQYTSGSTGTPKGVVVSHGNLLHNEEVIRVAFGHGPGSSFAGWLPLYHDMGLIGNVLQPLYLGTECTLISPVAFLQRPLRWLAAISHFRAETGGAPNFAYDLCVRKITEAERAGLDLRCWSVAYNGAEPVRQETLERFCRAFAPCGFRPEAFYPCYGLAEATLFVTGGLKAAAPHAVTLSAAALGEGLVAEAKDGDVRTLVSSGQVWLDQEVRIVHPEALRPCRPEEVGEIWLRGRSVAGGYWNRPEETLQGFAGRLPQTNEGPFLRTGDLGFVKDGQLFLTGRRKDLIIVRGRNHYPQDLELSLERCHPSLRPGCVAAFSVEEGGQERLAVVAELDVRRAPPDPGDLFALLRRVLSEEHDLTLSAVALVEPGTIPKTSSGKLQRHACRDGLVDGGLRILYRWDAVTEHAMESAGPQPQQAESRPDESRPDESRPDESRRQADDLVGWLREYAEQRIHSRLMDERRSVTPSILLDFGLHGLLGMDVPRAYGGLGLSCRASLRVFEQLAAIDLNLSLLVGNHLSLGVRPILRFARDDTRDELLPLLAQGRQLAAFALTERGAGSNPRAIASHATPESGGGWRLYGEKVWIGSASWAGVLNVFTQQRGARGEALGVTGFVVRQGRPGLRMGPESLTMGMRGMVQNAVLLEGVRVGEADLLGQEVRGMDVAEDAMLYARLGLGALCVGGMRRCAQLMLRYARGRTIGTGSLLENPVTRARLGELTFAIASLGALVDRTAALLDAGVSVPPELMIACKIAGPELLWRAADHLVQLLGARGYVETNLAPQLLRDARVLRIFEGPTETMQMHLGYQLSRSRTQLYACLGERFSVPDVASRLEDEIRELFARGQEGAPGTAGSNWAALAAGEVASAAILYAAARHQAESAPSAALTGAAAWSLLRWREARATALAAGPEGLPTAVALVDVIEGYEGTIGDLEQALAGEEQALDPALQRPKATQPVAAPPVAPAPEPAQKPATREDADAIQRFLRGWLARALLLHESEIDPDSPFAEYGLDSVAVVDLSHDLEEWLGEPVNVALVWSYPTIHALSRHLASGCRESGQRAEPPQEADVGGEVEGAPSIGGRTGLYRTG